MITTLRGLPRRAGRMGFVWAREALARNPGVYRPHGIPIKADARADFALRYLLARGAPYEAPEAQLIARHLLADTDVIELGGCIGIVSATIRKQIGAHASHIVVEANPDIAPLALENAQGPMPERTELVQAAVDYSGAHSVRFSRGHNQHVGHVARDGEDGFEARAVTLAQLAKKLSGRFALVCDIEGGEIPMFEAEAGGDTLARCDLLVLEVHPSVYADGEAGVTRLTELLADAGLQLVERVDQVIAYARAPSS